MTSYFKTLYFPFALIIIAPVLLAQQNDASPEGDTTCYQTDIIIYGGTAAVLAIDEGVAVQNVDYQQLRAQLLKDEQVLEYKGAVNGQD